MYNCSLIKLKEIGNGELGYLTAIESCRDIPFEIKRVYYITGVPSDIVRGNHAHRRLHQILICLNGSVKIKTEFRDNIEIYELNNPSIGLYVGPYVWRTMYDFSDDCVLMVLASDYYNEEDYIRNYEEYKAECNKIFGGV